MADSNSAINFQIGLDTKEAVSNANALTSAVKQIEDTTALASRALDAFGKIAIAGTGIITAVLKAPVDFDNFLGNLNQKITQVGDTLNRYGDTLLKFKGGAFKAGEGGFGLSDDDYKKIMMQYATGTTAIEKYGSSRDANLKDFTGGAGMAMKLLGFDPEQATSMMTSLHKTIGLTFSEMEPFVKQMGIIGKSANMNSTQFANLTKQVTGYAKAYGLSGEAGKNFITQSLAVGSAISQLGMDAEQTMAKMNEVATGSEGGLVTSLLLGFKPGDAKGQLAAFQAKAKEIVAIAQSAGDQFAPLIMQKLGSAYGMNFNPEQMMRLAQGLPADKASTKRDATDIYEDISTTLHKTLAIAEKPKVTAGQVSQATLNAMGALAITEFRGVIEELKTDVIANLQHWISTAKEWIIDVKKFFGIGGDAQISFKQLALAALGLAAIPAAITSAFGLVGGIVGAAIATALKGGAVAGVASSAAGPLGLTGGLGILGTVGLILGAAGVGAAIGTFVRKYVLSDKQNEWIGDKLVEGFNPSQKQKQGGSDSNLDLVDRKTGKSQREMMSEGFSDYGGMGMSGDQDTSSYPTSAIAKSAGSTKKTSLSKSAVRAMAVDTAKKLGFNEEQTKAFLSIIEQESGFNQNVPKGKAGEIGVTQLMPANVKKFGVTDPTDVAQNLMGGGKLLKTEFDRYPNDMGKAVAAYNAGDGHVNAGTIPKSTEKYVADVMSRMGPAGSLASVHDSTTNSTISSILSLLSQHLGGQPAMAGSPSPADPTARISVQAMSGGSQYVANNGGGY